MEKGIKTVKLSKDKSAALAGVLIGTVDIVVNGNPGTQSGSIESFDANNQPVGIMQTPTPDLSSNDNTVPNTAWVTSKLPVDQNLILNNDVVGDVRADAQTVTIAGDPATPGILAVAGIDANANKIVNVADPTLDQDAATKKYVDDTAGGGGLTILAGNFENGTSPFSSKTTARPFDPILTSPGAPLPYTMIQSHAGGTQSVLDVATSGLIVGGFLAIDDLSYYQGLYEIVDIVGAGAVIDRAFNGTQSGTAFVQSTFTFNPSLTQNFTGVIEYLVLSPVQTYSSVTSGIGGGAVLQFDASPNISQSPYILVEDPIYGGSYITVGFEGPNGVGIGRAFAGTSSGQAYAIQYFTALEAQETALVTLQSSYFAIEPTNATSAFYSKKSGELSYTQISLSDNNEFLAANMQVYVQRQMTYAAEQDERFTFFLSTTPSVLCSAPQLNILGSKSA